MTTPPKSTSVLFVCLGNICRSPLAEGVFIHQAKERGIDAQFHVDSAGTGNWHAGDLADARMRETATRHGVHLPSRARQVTAADFTTFDHIIAMDESNRRDLISVGAPKAKVRLLLELDPQAAVREVPDPYYGGPEGFEEVFALVDSACKLLLSELAE